jgi:hypothetical protein
LFLPAAPFLFLECLQRAGRTLCVARCKQACGWCCSVGFALWLCFRAVFRACFMWVLLDRIAVSQPGLWTCRMAGQLQQHAAQPGRGFQQCVFVYGQSVCVASSGCGVFVYDLPCRFASPLCVLWVQKLAVTVAHCIVEVGTNAAARCSPLVPPLCGVMHWVAGLLQCDGACSVAVYVGVEQPYNMRSSAKSIPCLL